MSISLAAIRNCFEGVIPSFVATLDADGQPNVSYLSQVYLVDETHVALSNQFFSKTAANVRATGRATVLVVDGRTGAQYALDLAYEASVAEGELFERMSVQLGAIASQHGMSGSMALRSAEVYRVTDVRAVPGPPSVTPPARATLLPAERMAATARLTATIAGLSDAEAMLDGALDGLADAFGFRHVMALTVDGEQPAITTLASRGYPTGGAGAEVRLGEGAIGAAAAAGRPVRLSDMSRGRRFAQAVRAGVEADAARVIPLPGLAEPQSQLAAPMIARGRVMGVLFAESAERFAFSPEDEETLALVGAQLAASLRLAELEAHEPPPAAPKATSAQAGPAFRVRYFRHDDSLFIDDGYVIKGVPGRLLFHFLQAFETSGRRDFTNREIRLEAALRLPDLKDNLETRLILLRRRLEERGAPVQLSRPGRGQIRLELSGAPVLEVVADAG